MMCFLKDCFFGRLGPQYSLCAYLKICVAIEGNGNCESKTNPTSPLIPSKIAQYETATVILKKHSGENAPTARQPDEQR